MAHVYTLGPGVAVESDEPLMADDVEKAREKVAGGATVETVARKLGARVFVPRPRVRRVAVSSERLASLLEQHYADEQAREAVLRELVQRG